MKPLSLGIFQQTRKNRDGLTFLSHIPFLGTLFTNTAEHTDKRVLIVFITPKLYQYLTWKITHIK